MIFFRGVDRTDEKRMFLGGGRGCWHTGRGVGFEEEGGVGGSRGWREGGHVRGRVVVVVVVVG